MPGGEVKEGDSRGLGMLTTPPLPFYLPPRRWSGTCGRSWGNWGARSPRCR